MVRTISISAWFYIFLAAAILLIPFHGLAAAVMAAVTHEIYHLLALSLCGVQVLNIQIGALGAKIQTEPMTAVQELICAAAGPVGSFSLLLVSDYLPLAAVFGVAQGVFNLLPAYPLDGGRILCAILSLISPRWGMQCGRWIGYGISFLLIATAFRLWR